VPARALEIGLLTKSRLAAMRGNRQLDLQLAYLYLNRSIETVSNTDR